MVQIILSVIALLGTIITVIVAPWVQPLGAHDAYKLGDKVTHNGKTWWESTVDNNAWEPGVYGWIEI